MRQFPGGFRSSLDSCRIAAQVRADQQERGGLGQDVAWVRDVPERRWAGDRASGAYGFLRPRAPARSMVSSSHLASSTRGVGRDSVPALLRYFEVKRTRGRFGTRDVGRA